MQARRSRTTISDKTGLRGRRLRVPALMALIAALAGCAVQAPGPDPVIVGVPSPTASAAPPSTTPNTARGSALAFAQVIRTLEPAVERECIQRRQTPINCDFQFVVDDRVGLEANAFQTVDSTGRPIIGFTLALLAASRNADELAFVVGHEASHHILGHINQKNSAASAGAVILSGIAAASGADAVAIKSAQRLGAQMGARYYSKDWELEADYLGAIVALNAGFDPEYGAQFFARIPDPGNRVMGTHPSRAQRQAVVSRAVADVRSGRAG
ncbi:M48 family metalloprotease [Paracoccus luteus]|uniref:M48 family metalloprotease n=1 Tax=Paracoccus luteus TaxID=2508543 RepID=UPI001FE78212|nr:M48 family metalloprotease [Paracoccus luteus]